MINNNHSIDTANNDGNSTSNHNNNDDTIIHNTNATDKGSGLVGGTFAPSLFIGAAGGALYGQARPLYIYIYIHVISYIYIYLHIYIYIYIC